MEGGTKRSMNLDILLIVCFHGVSDIINAVIIGEAVDVSINGGLTGDPIS